MSSTTPKRKMNRRPRDDCSTPVSKNNSSSVTTTESFVQVNACSTEKSVTSVNSKHSKDSSSKMPDTCRYGTRCKRKDCLYKHPKGRLIDQANDTDVAPNQLSKNELIRLIRELLSKASENMNSRPPKESQATDNDDEDEDSDYSDQSDDEEPILDIVKDHEIKQFELQQNEFRTMALSLQEKLDSLIKLNKKDNHEQLQYLYEQLQREMKHWKTRLPIYSGRTDIIKLVENNQISILKAETGSGKSTQVVQYLCDAGFAQKSTCILFRIHHKLFFRFRTNPCYSTAKTHSI